MPLTLEVKCPACKGQRKILMPGTKAAYEPCENCNGHGLVPGEDGRELIEFLNRYYRPKIKSEITHAADTEPRRTM